MSAAGFFTITRPANAVMAGVAAVVAYLVATGTLIPAVLLPFIVVVLVTAAGNVINDYFDVEIDRVNRPDRPIPSGLVTPRAARAFALTLFLAGILICLFTNVLCIVIAVFNSVLLVAYAARLKSMPLAGNVAVSYLSGSMFLFGGAFAGPEFLVRLLPIAAMTLLAMMARELLKDAEDVVGDAAGGASTVPIRIGVKRTAFYAFGFVLLAALVSIVPFRLWGAPYLAMIGIVDLCLLGGVYRTLHCENPGCVRNSGASATLKCGMFASLLVFVISVIFLG